jgi:hypothetical protein
MAELAHTEVQQPGEPGPRRPFVAPVVERLGRLETATLLSVEIPP